MKKIVLLILFLNSIIFISACSCSKIAEIQELRKQVNELQRKLVYMNQKLNEKQLEINHMNQKLNEKQLEIVHMNQKLNGKQLEIDRLSFELNEHKERNARNLNQIFR